MTGQGRVTVTLEDGTRVTLHDTPAVLTAIVVRLAEDLTAAEFATLTIDVNAGDVKYKLERRYAPIKRHT